MTSTRAWRVCPSQMVSRVWLLATISTRASLGFRFQSFLNTWLSATTSTRASSRLHCRASFKAWDLVMASGRDHQVGCRQACAAWIWRASSWRANVTIVTMTCRHSVGQKSLLGIPSSLAAMPWFPTWSFHQGTYEVVLWLLDLDLFRWFCEVYVYIFHIKRIQRV